MNIEEIALRVASEEGAMRQIRHRGVDGIEYHFETGEELIAFAHALLAELSKEAAPVIASEQKPVAHLSRHFASDTLDIGNEGAGSKNGWSAAFPVFTSLPNTADIEQRVAEACAKMRDKQAENLRKLGFFSDADIHSDGAEAIRSGKWREYL